MAQVAGVRDTRQSITSENVLERFIGDEIILLEPSGTPLLTFLMEAAQKKRKPTFSPRIEWLEDDYVARWGTMDTTTAATTGTTIAVLDGTQFVVGDLIVFPRSTSTSTTPEQARVSGIATNVLTIVRGSNAVPVPASSAIRIIGSAAEEGGGVPTAKSTTKATKTSFTQIFRTSMKFSKTATATRQYGSPNGDRKFEQKKKLIEHKQKMNAQAIWGVASESLTGGASGFPLRTTMGINSQISTNVVDCSGTLTKKLLETFARSAFRYGSDQKLLLCSALLKSAINDFGQSFLKVSPMEKVLGVNINRVETAHGTFLLARDWMLENGVAGQAGFGNMGLSIDVEECRYYYLSENGENRDTRLLEDVTKDGTDAYVDEYLTEGGFAFRMEKKHAKLFNFTDYSA